MEIAENLGGVPQRFTAMQYELSADIRERTSGLSNLTWSPLQDNTVLLVCETKKTKEYKDTYGSMEKYFSQIKSLKTILFRCTKDVSDSSRTGIGVWKIERA